MYLGLIVVMLAALEIPLGVQFGAQRAADAGDEGRARRDDDRFDRARHATNAHAATAPGNRRRRVPLPGRHRRPGRDRQPQGRRRDRHEREGAGVTSFGSRPEIASALRGNVAVGNPRLADAAHATSSMSRCPSRPTDGSKEPLGSPIRRRQWTRASGATGSCSPRSRPSCSPSPIVVGLAVATFVGARCGASRALHAMSAQAT